MPAPIDWGFATEACWANDVPGREIEAVDGNQRVNVWRICVAVACVSLAPATTIAQSISAEEAANHIGQEATVCGSVASARYASRSRGKPTFLNLSAPYPRQIFIVVIWGEDRGKFGQPETTYTGERICVTGRIALYRRMPEIIIRDPAMLRPDSGKGGQAPVPPGLKPAQSE
jgi:DNA/RNA endonuclease YhcR with UshA esterase domain